MKKIYLFGLMLMFSFSAMASFPVNKKNAAKVSEKIAAEQVVTVDQETAPAMEVNLDVAPEDAISPAAAADDGNRTIILLLLWFFLGWPFAAHRWYAKKPAGWNVLFILTFAGFGIWAIVDLINILTDNF